MKKDIIFESYEEKIDISVVREFEKKTGFKFPQSYIDIVIDYNEARIANHMDIFYFYSNFIDRYESRRTQVCITTSYKHCVRNFSMMMYG